MFPAGFASHPRDVGAAARPGAIGAVIRGGTPHFEHVAGECTKGIASVSLQTGIPVAFGVLTVDTIEQAIERAGTKSGNKGFDAAVALLELMDLYDQI